MVKNKKKGLLNRLSSFDEMKRNFSLTKELMQETKKEKAREFIKESFEEALERFGVEDKKTFLDKKYKEMRKNSIISYLFFLILNLINVYNILSGGTVMYGVIFILISLYFFVNGLTMALRCYQMKMEKLGMLKQFLRSFRNWIPSKERIKGI
jgi:uncharacterized protein YjgD (DUF1641 family)